MTLSTNHIVGHAQANTSAGMDQAKTLSMLRQTSMVWKQPKTHRFYSVVVESRSRSITLNAYDMGGGQELCYTCLWCCQMNYYRYPMDWEVRGIQAQTLTYAIEWTVSQKTIAGDRFRTGGACESDWSSDIKTQDLVLLVEANDTSLKSGLIPGGEDR